MKRKWSQKLLAVTAALVFCVSGALLVLADSDILQSPGNVSERQLAPGVSYTEKIGAASSAGKQNIYTVTYDYTDPNYDLVVSGQIGSRATVSEMAKSLAENPHYQVLAGVNGDHFSYGTGIPLGFCMDDGEILESPVTDKEADGYFFHSFGVKRDGTSLSGYNPTLIATHKKAGMPDSRRCTISRINRTRESFAPSVLFTPAYGSSTKTTDGKELIIKIVSGNVGPQSNPLIGEITDIRTEGNSPLEAGTVVLSCQGSAERDLDMYAVGDRIEMTFTFLEEEWNDVDFAIGGNYAIVQNGKAVEVDYAHPDNPDSDGSPFIGSQPRTAIGITQAGKVVIVAVDGRRSDAIGLSANEMAHYMAEDMQCENAVLMDGGGSTAIGVLFDGAFQVRNHPSDKEERAVGNGVFLVKRDTPRPSTAPTAPTKPQAQQPLNLLPGNSEQFEQTKLSATLQAGSITLHSTGAGAVLKYPVNSLYSIKKLPNLYFSLQSDVGVNIRINYVGVNRGKAGITDDWGPDFHVSAGGYLKPGVYDDRGENGADYTGMVAFTGSVSYNQNIPPSNLIRVESVEILCSGAGTVTVGALYMGDLATDDVPGPGVTDIPGDVVADGDITMADAQNLFLSITEGKAADADFNEDGQTDIEDILWIYLLASRERALG